jgi:Protein of unknown function (DUF2894)
MSSGGACNGGTCATIRLDAWRAHGDDRLDPVRFRFMEVLDRRAAGHTGEVRRILDERLSQLLEAYADDLERAASRAADAGNAVTQCEPARGALAGLIDYIAGHTLADGDSAAADDAVRRPPSSSKLEVLDYVKDVWSKVSTERQLRQSLEQVPSHAGPLNSSSLVYRSLALMHELSPDYLRQFLSYVEALSSIEQMSGAGTLAGKEAPRAGNAKNRGRGKPR